MKKVKFILGVVALLAAGLAMTGCDGLTAINNDDLYVAPDAETISVGLGGENTLNVSRVAVNGATDSSLVDNDFKPSAWNAISEFITVDLAAGDYVEYTFTQPTQSSNAWETWALAFYDDNNNGNFLRADAWLNSSTDAGFGIGLWGNGGATSSAEFSNDYTYSTAGSMLPTNATVVLKVAYDGTNVTVTETVNGTLAQTVSSANW
ncbi:MAG: hypothetical protein WCQ67_05750 [Treponema sp.]